MPLAPGQLVAHYRIDRKIGEGGMGEVWAATDTRLNRPAAIKALPAGLAGDPERLARFRREAQLLASLNHPNIAAIYGLEQSEDTPYLALELVEGEDLAERLKAGPIPSGEAVEIAAQIAAALEEAHDKGIVHRDLKPANVKVTPDGKVKVLDFGLAKALSGDAGADGFDPSVSMSPTMTAAMGGTQAGIILGTASYMAPEQARGKAVDRRADIWAFGVVLHEMLTGERLFGGETVTDVIAAVVTREPEWDRLPTETPRGVRRLLRRCLQKDPRRRLRDIGDARLELIESSDEADAPEARAAADGSLAADRAGVARRGRWTGVAAGAAVALALAAVLHFTILAPRVEPAPPTWTTLSPPPGTQYLFRALMEISPDGRRVAFVAPAPDDPKKHLLWVRDLETETARPLAGTAGATFPFWSPDSRFLGYFDQRRLQVISADGGPPASLTSSGFSARGGSWGADGTILYCPEWSHPVFRIPATGGTPEPVTELSDARLELSHRWPQWLPDGRHFLYYAVSTYPPINPDNPSEVDQSGLYLGSLDGGEPRLIQKVRSRAVYRDGHLLYVDGGVLFARPFDLDRLDFAGEPVALTDGVNQAVDALWGAALFSVSEEGTLFFARGASERDELSRLVWRNRAGKELGRIGDPAPYNAMRISHGGSRVAVSIADPGDVWIHDVAQGTTTRFTFDTGNDARPQWSPDDQRIVFQSARLLAGKKFSPANLMMRLASGGGSEEHLHSFDGLASPLDWHPDGDLILFTTLRRGAGADLMLYSMEQETVTALRATEADEDAGRFSPDGRWVAYASDESGQLEVYAEPFPPTGGRWQISTGGGGQPVWTKGGREILYVDLEGDLISVPITVTPAGLQAGGATVLFRAGMVRLAQTVYGYDATPDGERLLLLEAPEVAPDAGAVVTLLQNWPALLHESAPKP